MAKQAPAKRTATPQRSASKPAAGNDLTLYVLSGQPSSNRIVSKSAVKRARPVAKKAANAKVAAKKAAPAKRAAPAKKAAPKRAAAKRVAKKPAAAKRAAKK